MSFFDDKQEILKVELTTYGRYLISRGKFKPAYYSFFDDDVLYDSEYADLTETQNSTQTRILDETISLKPQITFTSVENNIKSNTLASKEGKEKTEESQISTDKNYALTMPLGNSSLSSIYAPSWNFKTINGSIDQISQYLDNSNNDLDIAQPFLKHLQIGLQDSIYDIKKSKNDSLTKEDYNIITIYPSGSDSYFYSMKDSPIILDLQENNVDNLIKNFDIEMFVEEQQIVPGTNQTKTILKQLNFKKDTINVLNGILLDEPITFEVQEDDTFVEYFFEMTLDQEIELPPQQKAVIPSVSGSYNGPFGVDC